LHVRPGIFDDSHWNSPKKSPASKTNHNQRGALSRRTPRSGQASAESQAPGRSPRADLFGRSRPKRRAARFFLREGDPSGYDGWIILIIIINT